MNMFTEKDEWGLTLWDSFCVAVFLMLWFLAVPIYGAVVAVVWDLSSRYL